jgi:hypothetical protein
MKTDSILEELYATRAKMMQAAGNDFNRLFDQMRERHQAYEVAHPEVQWVDFSQTRKATPQPKTA